MFQTAVFSPSQDAKDDPGSKKGAIMEYLIAAALEQSEMVCYFVEIEGLHPDATWGGRPTAVCYAAMKRNPRLVTYLLDNGASANQSDALSMTPLHYAALGGCEVCVATLIAHGARLNARNTSGKTPLALAQRETRLALCRELLQRHGAAVDQQPDGPARFH